MRIIVLSLIGFSIVPAAAAGQTAAPVSPPRTVTLTLAEFNRLIDLGEQPDTAPLSPPAPAAVATADLRVRVDAGMARGVFTIAGEVLLEGIAQVPLIKSATIIEAAANGRAVPLISENGTYAALLEGPGAFTVALGWGAPVTQGAGRASFVVPVPAAAAAHATIDLPGDQADVHATSGLITSRLVINGRTLVDVTLDPGSSAVVSWSLRDSVQTAPAREVRASADVFTLMTVGETDLRMATLVDITMLQGELRTLDVTMPPGFEVSSVSGAVSASAPTDKGIVLTLLNPAARSHQFLIGLERPHSGGTFAVETVVPTMPAMQRERGEIAIEGVGTLDLTADARDSVHRMDVREVSPSLQALDSQPLLAAFRYQRTGTVTPGVALDVKRFADAGVLAAVAERAEATTLVTAEGRALTEVKLQVRNRAQPFLKVLLPAGASMISVNVAGESAKPVLGTDGTRVPLLRPGFRPKGVYEVSFVYLHAGVPFARKGDIAMALPRLDMPIALLSWEVFVPERYSARAIDGNAIDVRRFPNAAVSNSTANAPKAAPGTIQTAMSETVRVGAEAPAVQPPFRLSVDLPEQPSQNVISLQQRTSGVLPIRVEVPRAGTSHRFVKPLVIDQETTVTLRYRQR